MSMVIPFVAICGEVLFSVILGIKLKQKYGKQKETFVNITESRRRVKKGCECFEGLIVYFVCFDFFFFLSTEWWSWRVFGKFDCVFFFFFFIIFMLVIGLIKFWEESDVKNRFSYCVSFFFFFSHHFFFFFLVYFVFLTVYWNKRKYGKKKIECKIEKGRCLEKNINQK
jgi:hypothetical protein